MPDSRPSPRQRFLDYVRMVPGARPVVSPFIPYPDVVAGALECLGLPTGDDAVDNEIRLSRALDYEPMFMTDCRGLIFPWREDENRSDDEWIVSVISTCKGEWTKRVSRRRGDWGDESGFPVQDEVDYEMLGLVCADVPNRESEIRNYFRDWRQRVGDNGVLVIGHPHIPWVGCQVGQRNLVYHYYDYPETFRLGLRSVYEAACYVFGLAMDEGIDFMSEGSFALEMTSPAIFDQIDLPNTRALADWTHSQGGLFWYHNCGHTRDLILSRRFDELGADVIETIAPPPEGDNDLAESRQHLGKAICSKGNLSLRVLRNGTVEDIQRETERMVLAVEGYPHIFSTADTVLPGTPGENLIAFVRTAQETSTRA